MGGFFGGGDKPDTSAQDAELAKLKDVEAKKKEALKRARRGRASLISGEATGIEKAKTLGGK